LTGKAALLYTERFLEYNLGPGPPLRPVRVKLTYDLLKAKGILDDAKVSVVVPQAATEQEILLFHDEE